MDRHLQRARNAARLAPLTRAAYTAGEGLLPEAEPDDEHDDEIPFDPPTRQRGERTAARRRWRVGLTPRAGLGPVLAVVLLVVVLAVRSLAAAGGGAGVAVAPSTGTDASGAARDVEVTGAATPSPTAAGVVVVHVAGEVASPGVVTLAAGSRVQDAVAAAGGPSPQADLGALNLARVVADGEQVYVPAPGEVPPDGAGSGEGAGGGSAGGPPGAVVNVNTADAAALDMLPGIGPALAQRILDWRTANGPFTDVAELTEVSGIGPATLERLLPLVTV